MDTFKNKYLKYKKKYIDLKNNLMGGNPLYLNNPSILTKGKYEKMNMDEKNEFPFYCPKKSKYLCTINTPNFGLCKNKLEDCDVYNGENKYPILDIESNPDRSKMVEKGKDFGYNLNSDKNCSKLELNSKGDYKLTKSDKKVPDKFKIMTWNLWYSMKETGDKEKDLFHIDFFNKRMEIIADKILSSNADIVCLQEIGELTFDQIYPSIKLVYPYFYENPSNFEKNTMGKRKRNLETLCLSKYPAQSFKLFGVEGNLDYNNSMLMIEYDKFIVFNVYLQAGTKYSPGQKDLWFNYSRCRYNEYMSIQNYINKNKLTKPIIVLGDFNTNLNGNYDEWPELRAFQQMNLDDFWLKKSNNNSGFTENTQINLMRWNVKFEEKELRIDGIFGSADLFYVKKIKLIGTKPFNIDSEFQDKFIKYRVPNIEDKLSKIRKNNDEIKLWPSDHFGVLAEIILK